MVVQRTRAVRGTAVEHAAVARVDVVLRRAVQQHVEVRAHVQVAQLQGAGQREDQGDVFLGGGRLADGRDVGRGSGGQATGQRGVAVDVEFEEVEEGVVDHGDRAVDLGLDAVVEFQRLPGLVTFGEGPPLDLVLRILYVFTCFSI